MECLKSNMERRIPCQLRHVSCMERHRANMECLKSNMERRIPCQLSRVSCLERGISKLDDIPSGCALSNSCWRADNASRRPACPSPPVTIRLVPDRAAAASCRWSPSICRGSTPKTKSVLKGRRNHPSQNPDLTPAER